MSSDVHVSALQLRAADEFRHEGRDVAIRARGLTKTYQVFAHPRDRLWQLLQPHRPLYREFVAVHPVDLDVHRGETMGIVGRNGSGKSTLLKMIAGTLERTGGELELRGHVAPILTLGAGFNPDFSGRENVYMNAAVLGLSDRETRRRIDSIADFAGIGEFFDQPVRSYSSGMYSRLAFAVAINADPDILVVDEVLAVGDEAFTRKCFGRIEEIKKQGSTILFVSHSPHLVMELCDRAVLLERGERLLTSDPKTVLAQYHRLLYAPAQRAAALVKEIRGLDAGASSTSGPDEGVAGLRSDGSAGAKSEAKSRTRNSSRERRCVEAEGSFDPHLQPESTVAYEPRGAVIEEPRVLGSDGGRLNVLRPNRVYCYTYDVRFDEPAFRVRFGMMIKLTTGFELAGQASHPPGDGIEYVEAGARLRVRFWFRTRLLPGSYFLNAGVLGAGGEGEMYLHRILDAAMVRVESPERLRITGRADLSTGSGAEIEFVATSAGRGKVLA